MVYSKSKEVTKSSKQHEPSAETKQIIARNCAILMESKPWNIYWFSQGQKKEHLNRMQEIQFRETSATMSESNTILTESKPKVQKILIFSKSREGTAESSGATRFSNTSVDVQ